MRSVPFSHLDSLCNACNIMLFYDRVKGVEQVFGTWLQLHQLEERLTQYISLLHGRQRHSATRTGPPSARGDKMASNVEKPSGPGTSSSSIRHGPLSTTVRGHPMVICYLLCIEDIGAKLNKNCSVYEHDGMAKICGHNVDDLQEVVGEFKFIYQSVLRRSRSETIHVLGVAREVKHRLVELYRRWRTFVQYWNPTDTQVTVFGSPDCVNTIAADLRKMMEDLAERHRQLSRLPHTGHTTMNRQHSSTQPRQEDSHGSAQEPTYSQAQPGPDRRQSGKTSRDFEFRSITFGRNEVRIFSGDILLLPVKAIVNYVDCNLNGPHRDRIASMSGDRIQNELIACVENHVRNSGPLRVSDIFVTSATQLKCGNIIHAVAPQCHEVLRRNEHERWTEQLHRLYWRCLAAASRRDLDSIGFSALSEEVFGIPTSESFPCLLQVLQEFFTSEENVNTRLRHVAIVPNRHAIGWFFNYFDRYQVLGHTNPKPDVPFDSAANGQNSSSYTRARQPSLTDTPPMAISSKSPARPLPPVPFNEAKEPVVTDNGNPLTRTTTRKAPERSTSISVAGNVGSSHDAAQMPTSGAASKSPSSVSLAGENASPDKTGHALRQPVSTQAGRIRISESERSTLGRGTYSQAQPGPDRRQSGKRSRDFRSITFGRTEVRVFSGDILFLPVKAIVNYVDCHLNGPHRDRIASKSGDRIQNELIACVENHVRNSGQLRVSDVFVTSAPLLSCGNIIHAVAPQCHGVLSRNESERCTEQLRSLYRRCLAAASRLDLDSIGFSALDEEVFGIRTRESFICLLEILREFFTSAENVHTRLRHVSIVPDQHAIERFFNCFDQVFSHTNPKPDVPFDSTTKGPNNSSYTRARQPSLTDTHPTAISSKSPARPVPPVLFNKEKEPVVTENGNPLTRTTIRDAPERSTSISLAGSVGSSHDAAPMPTSGAASKSPSSVSPACENAPPDITGHALSQPVPTQASRIRISESERSTLRRGTYSQAQPGPDRRQSGKRSCDFRSITFGRTEVRIFSGDILLLPVKAIVNFVDCNLNGPHRDRIASMSGERIQHELIACVENHVGNSGQPSVSNVFVTSAPLLSCGNIIHAVAPQCQRVLSFNEHERCTEQLRSLYRRSLAAASRLDLESIGFSALDEEVFGIRTSESLLCLLEILQEFFTSAKNVHTRLRSVAIVPDQHAIGWFFNCFDQVFSHTNPKPVVSLDSTANGPNSTSYTCAHQPSLTDTHPTAISSKSPARPVPPVLFNEENQPVVADNGNPLTRTTTRDAPERSTSISVAGSVGSSHDAAPMPTSGAASKSPSSVSPACENASPDKTGHTPSQPVPTQASRIHLSESKTLGRGENCEILEIFVREYFCSFPKRTKLTKSMK